MQSAFSAFLISRREEVSGYAKNRTGTVRIELRSGRVGNAAFGRGVVSYLKKSSW